MKTIITLLILILVSCKSYKVEEINYHTAHKNLKTYISSNEFKKMSKPKMHNPKIDIIENENSYEVEFTIYGHKYVEQEKTIIHLKKNPEELGTRIKIRSYDIGLLKTDKRNEEKERIYLSKIIKQKK